MRRTVINGDLFASDEDARTTGRVPSPSPVPALPAGAALLPGFALPHEAPLLEALHAITSTAPFRHMETPGGHRMSVAMTNCGDVGWVADRRGYRYDARDPDRAQAWPPMPPAFRALAERAAFAAGYAHFAPDACLINRYEPGARLSLHQDRNERDVTAPIVSISLGLSATFQFGGLERTDRTVRIPLVHGDVVVWGGPVRMAYHGVLALKDGVHPRLGRMRINLTFRTAR